ncbi:hypothetical protein BGZ72_009481, partial [Mortierella alpina]
MPTRHDTAFPRKWYLTGNDQQILTSQEKHDPYRFVDCMNIPIVHTGAEPASYWINVFVMVSADTLNKLKSYAKKKPSANLEDLQTIEVAVSVNINNNMVLKFKSSCSLRNKTRLSPNKPIALRVHQQIELEKDQKLQLVLKPMTQVKQAGGLQILWIEMVNLKIAYNPIPYISMVAVHTTHTDTHPSRWYLTLKDKDITAAQTKGDPYLVLKERELRLKNPFTLLQRQAFCADSHVLLLLHEPIHLDLGSRVTLEFTVGARLNQAGGFKVHNVDLVDSHCKIKVKGLKDTILLEIDEEFRSKWGALKKGSAVDKKTFSNSQACGNAAASTSGTSGSTSNDASNNATGGTVKDATSHITTSAASGAVSSVLNSSSDVVNNTILELSDGNDSSSSNACSSPNSTASRVHSSTSNSATTSTTVSATSSAANSRTNTSDGSFAGCLQTKSLAPAHCQNAAKSSMTSASSVSTTVHVEAKGASNSSVPANNKAQKNESKTTAAKPAPLTLTNQNCKEDSQSPADFLKIAVCKIDKSGTRLATLSYGKKSFHLDVWDIEDTLLNPGLDGKTAEINIASGRVPHSPSSSGEKRQVASLKENIGDQLNWNHRTNMTIALSFGAAQVALIPHSLSEPEPQSLLLFECHLARKTFVPNDPHENLKRFVGYGDFVCPLLDSGKPNTTHERFLACDGYSATVYRCHADLPWILLWNISLTGALPRSPQPSVDYAKCRQNRQNSANPLYCGLSLKPTPTTEGLSLAEKLVQSVRHRYFAWAGHAEAVSIWDFETGNAVSYIPLPYEHEVSDICTYLSVDGSVTVIWYRGRGIVGRYWTASGIRIKVYTEKAGIFGGQFLVSEYVNSGQIKLQKTKSHLPNLLDGSKRHLAKSLYDLQGDITIAAAGNQSLMHVKGPVVTVTGLDTAFAQITNNKDCQPTCSALDAPKLSENRIYRAGPESVAGIVFDFHRASGTRFVMTSSLVSGSVLYTLKLICKEAKETILLVFSHKFKYALLSGDADNLILIDERYVQIWMIPHDFGAYCRLLLAWCVNQGAGSEGFWSEPFEPRLCCHNRTLTMDMRETGQNMEFILSDPKVFTAKTAERFLGGMQLLTEMYTSVRELNPQTPPGNKRDCLMHAISKYLGGYINHNPTPHQPLNTVLAKICHSWTYDEREIYKDILRKILYPTKCWAPAPYYRSYKDSNGNMVSSNPINILLMRNDARVINTARLLYNYCLQRAEEAGQTGYLAPVFDSLPVLFLQHQNHAFKYFCDMALIKAAEAPFLREMYPIVPNTEDQWHNQQLGISSTPPNSPAVLENTDDEGNRGEADVFIASYDMLWECNGHGAVDDDMSLLSWLVCVLAQGLHPTGRNFIKRHKFCMKFLDSPAIEALIDQKWSTIGLGYWLLCFISQCYVLALLLQ